MMRTEIQTQCNR